jgi:GAF domain-containing protein
VTDEAVGGDGAALEQARETIARQERELESLRDALTRAAAAGVIGSPVSHARLLEMIVETGAHVIGARAGALFLLDEEKSELTFEVAIGPESESVKRFRVPLGHGIAGIVAASGQAMAISDAANDARLASDIAGNVGYVPQTVLCVPLYYGARVIGALELLDKQGGGTFSAADMEALGLFANQAAVALQLSRTHQNVARVLTGGDGDEEAGGGEQDAASRDALELAELVHEIARRGESERAACRALLLGFAGYLRSRSGLADDRA